MTSGDLALFSAQASGRPVLPAPGHGVARQASRWQSPPRAARGLTPSTSVTTGGQNTVLEIHAEPESLGGQAHQ